MDIRQAAFGRVHLVPYAMFQFDFNVQSGRMREKLRAITETTQVCSANS